MRAKMQWCLAKCLALAFVSLAAAGGQRFSEFPPAPLLQLQQPHFDFLRMFTKATNAPAQTGMRTTLQSDRLCIWDDGLCQVNIGPKAPLNDALDIFEEPQAECEKENDESDCDSNISCYWDTSTGTCQLDGLYLLRDCLEPEYLIYLTASDCKEFTSKSECTSNDICKWYTAIRECRTDEVALKEATNKNKRLRKAMKRDAKCGSSFTCPSPCADVGPCVYRPLADLQQWFDSSVTSRQCRILQQNARCNWIQIFGDPCRESCEINENGKCVPTTKNLVEVVFAEDPEQRDRILDGIEVCSDYDDEDGCKDAPGRR